jgi:hypothetical protein
VAEEMTMILSKRTSWHRNRMSSSLLSHPISMLPYDNDKSLSQLL